VSPTAVLGWVCGHGRRAVGPIVPSLAVNFVLKVGGRCGFAPLAGKGVSRVLALAGPVITFIGISLATQTAESEIGPEVRGVFEG